MESLNQKIIKRKTVYENTRKGTLKLAQIADNSSYRKSLQQKKGEKKRGGYAIPKYKIRILGEHSGSIRSQALPRTIPGASHVAHRRVRPMAPGRGPQKDHSGQLTKNHRAVGG